LKKARAMGSSPGGAYCTESPATPPSGVNVLISLLSPSHCTAPNAGVVTVA
jgi:hypothetical protein